MDALTKRVLNVADAKHKAAVADAAATAMAEHCDRRIAEKDAQIALLRGSLQEMCDFVAPTIRSETRLSAGLSSALIRARGILK